MQRLLFVLLVCPLTVATQSNLNDLDGDGCVGATDILVILGQYGECNDTVPFVECGDPVSYWNHDYETVLIGNQCWFAENLRNSQYANGDSIPLLEGSSDWCTTNSGAQCYYLNDEIHLNTSGRLYNWHAISDARGLCPAGWHIPTDLEWVELEVFLGMDELEAINSTSWRGSIADSLKSKPTETPPWDGINSTGFSAIRGGWRDGHNGCGFYEMPNETFFWSSTLASSNSAFLRRLRSGYIQIERPPGLLRLGVSARCLKD